MQKHPTNETPLDLTQHLQTQGYKFTLVLL